MYIVIVWLAYLITNDDAEKFKARNYVPQNKKAAPATATLLLLQPTNQPSDVPTYPIKRLLCTGVNSLECGCPRKKLRINPYATRFVSHMHSHLSLRSSIMIIIVIIVIIVQRAELWTV